MNVRLTLIAAVVAVALAGAGCQAVAVPKPSPAQGPSPFLAGFSVARVVAAFEAAANGVHCPGMQQVQALSQSSLNGWTEAGVTATCDDPGDGTALSIAWARGIDAEIKGLGALDLGGGWSSTGSGPDVRGEWLYESRGLRGHISVQVLPAPEGRYWLIVRITEPSCGPGMC